MIKFNVPLKHTPVQFVTIDTLHFPANRTENDSIHVKAFEDNQQGLLMFRLDHLRPGEGHVTKAIVGLLRLYQFEDVKNIQNMVRIILCLKH